MRALVAIALMGFTSLISATPVPKSAPGGTPVPATFPLADGFPGPTPEELQTISKGAHGTLPNATAPPKISAEGATNLQLIAFGETMEAAYFTEVLSNITNNVPGYQIESPKEKAFFEQTFRLIEQQEELHSLNANNALKHFNMTVIQPCKYNFPVNTLSEAIDFAYHFTDLVVGTLQDVIQHFADNGDGPLTRGVAAAIGMEGEQMGWFRVLQGKAPNELPFLTTSVRDFAFTAVNSLTVPGSCPNIDLIPLKIYQPLTLLSTPKPRDEQLTFQLEVAGDVPLWITYVNQQNLPVTVPLSVVSKTGNLATVQALFPYTEHLLNGLTIAVTTNSAGPFATARAVAAATVHGPALLIVN